MGSENLTVEEKLDGLYGQVDLLARRVADLEARLATAAPGFAAGGSVARPAAVTQPAAPAEEGADGLSDQAIRWAGRASLFPRLATLCFLLAIALVLRTITDNGLVNPLLGMVLGMGYAAALMAAGSYQYRRGSSLAPVFVACGAILLSSIVVETHARFRSLPLVPAYWTLMATGAFTTFVSRQSAAFLPVSVGTLGMCLAGAAIDYPDPYFPYLFMILLTANVLGYYAGTLKRCGWLRWTVLLVTLAMFLLWGTRLAAVAARKIAATPALAPAWFLPVLAAASVAFLTIALLGIARVRGREPSVFDYCLPTINAVGSYLAARVVVSGPDGSALALGLVAILFALIQFGAAVGLSARDVDGAPGANAFLVAGSALLALALPAVLGNVSAAAPVLGAAALAMAVLSGRWGSGAVRATSYLLQAYAAASLALFTLAQGAAPAPLGGAISTAALGAAAGLHYRWCRRHPPHARSLLFGTYDPRDLSGAVTLLAALAASFFFLRGIAWGLFAGGSADSEAFRCAQSVIVNLAALGLGLYAFRTRSREVRNVAMLVIAVGAVRSAADLLGASGVPLVLSVLSFGLAAAAQSVILGRWQRSSPAPRAETFVPGEEPAAVPGE
jgi:hypothetical protein